MSVKLTVVEVDRRLAKKNIQRTSPYIGAQEPLSLICTICGREWKSTLGKCGCQICQRLNHRLKIEEVDNLLLKQNLRRLSSYEGSEIDMLVECLVCGYQATRRLHNILKRKNRGSCFSCGTVKGSKVRSLPKHKLRERLSHLEKMGIVLLDEPVGALDNRLMRFRCQYGHQWTTRAGRTIRGERGCKLCERRRIQEKQRLPDTELGARLAALNGIIMIGPYLGAQITTEWQCGKCNHKWLTTPHSVFPDTKGNKGSGCPRCAPYGFQQNKSGLLYYVRVTNSFGDPVYKIGITNRTVSERFQSEVYKVTIIETWHFQNGAEAYEMEQDILTDYASDLYEGPPVLKAGNEEIFVRDVLQLDLGGQQLKIAI